MKVLITTDLFTTATNGVVTSVKNLVSTLEKNGHEVRVLTLSENAKSRREGKVTYIRSMPFGVYPDVRMPLSYRHKLIKELIAWKPDVIHSQCEFFSFQFALRIHKKTGAPIVHTYHTLYEQYAKYVIPIKKLGYWAVRVFSRKRLKKVSRVIAPTRKTEEALLSYGLKNDISIVPTGISLEQHRQRITAEQREQMRRDLGIPANSTVLLNLGRLGTEKNPQELLHFFAKARKIHPELIFLVVGDGPAREEMQKLCKTLEIEAEVIFTGMVDPARVQEYYQLGDLFISASTSETQGLTYVEAAANGLPLLCRKDPCLKDVIRQGENGYEYSDEEEFLAHLDAFLADPAWRVLAAEISQSLAERFDKSAFGLAIDGIYKEVIR